MSFTLNAFKTFRPSGRALLVAAAAAALALSAAGRPAPGQDLRKFNQFVQTGDTPALRMLREGRDLIDAEQWEQAAEKFGQFVNTYGKRDKDVDVALYWLAYSLNKKGDARGAVAPLAQLLKKHADSAWADEARALLNEIAGTLGDSKVLQSTLDSSKEDEEIKIVALQSLFEASPERGMSYAREILKPGSTASPRLKSAAVSLAASQGGPAAAAFLLEVARGGGDPELRARAIHGLASEGGEAFLDQLAQLYDAERDVGVKRQMLHAFAGMEGSQRAHAKLLQIAANRGEAEDLRRAAIHWLGERKGAAAFDSLAQLYSSEQDVEIKRQLIHGFFDTGDPRAFPKLVEIARNAAEQMELRRSAVHWLGEQENAAAFDSLSQLYASERDAELKRQILHAFAEMEDPRARARLGEIARNASEDKDVRRAAIHLIGESKGDAALDELTRLYDAERDPEIRRQLLHAFSEMESPRARQKLVEAARSGEDVEVRRQAIHLLGEGDDAQSLDLLLSLYDAERSDEVKRQLLHAFGESKQKRALQKLMDVARREQSVELRKAAVHLLGESDDPEALRFLEDLLKP